MSEAIAETRALERGQGPKDWPQYRFTRSAFSDEIMLNCDALAKIAIDDGAKRADAVNAVVHELLYIACLMAFANAKENLGREPRREQWDSVVGDIFNRTASAFAELNCPTFAVAS